MNLDKLESYIKHFDAPCYAGCQWTTRQIVCGLLELYQRHGPGKEELNDHLTFVKRVLPQPNFWPPSIHILRGLSGAPEWTKFEVHVCANSKCRGHVYKQLPREDWGRHANDVCPVCGTSRFEVKMTGGTSVGLTARAPGYRLASPSLQCVPYLYVCMPAAC